jgi:hypothetical protein
MTTLDMGVRLDVRIAYCLVSRSVSVSPTLALAVNRESWSWNCLTSAFAVARGVPCRGSVCGGTKEIKKRITTTTTPRLPRSDRVGVCQAQELAGDESQALDLRVPQAPVRSGYGHTGANKSFQYCTGN